MISNQAIIDKLRAEEGVRTKVYKCSEGFDTIGVGFNLERAGAEKTIKALGVDYATLRAGKASLTTAQIDALLTDEISVILADLRKLIAGFDKMPDTVQLVLCDMRYQLGAGGLRGFGNTLNDFRSAKWKSAAARMRLSDAYKQTPKRWERNCRLLEKVFE